jgi:hypothetical protein
VFDDADRNVLRVGGDFCARVKGVVLKFSPFLGSELVLLDLKPYYLGPPFRQVSRTFIFFDAVGVVRPFLLLLVRSCRRRPCMISRALLFQCKEAHRPLPETIVPRTEGDPLR